MSNCGTGTHRMDAAVVSKYGLTVWSKQYESYFASRQESMFDDNNCSDGSIVAGHYKHTACLRFGDAFDVAGNMDYPPGRTWTMPRVVMQNVSRARALMHDMYFYRLEAFTGGYIVGQARNVQPKAKLPRPSFVSRPYRDLAVFLFPPRSSSAIRVAHRLRLRCRRTPPRYTRPCALPSRSLLICATIGSLSRLRRAARATTTTARRSGSARRLSIGKRRTGGRSCRGSTRSSTATTPVDASTPSRASATALCQPRRHSCPDVAPAICRSPYRPRTPPLNCPFSTLRAARAALAPPETSTASCSLPTFRPRRAASTPSRLAAVPPRLPRAPAVRAWGRTRASSAPHPL